MFGSCVIHILYTVCAKIKKKNNNSGAKGLNRKFLLPHSKFPAKSWARWLFCSYKSSRPGPMHVYNFLNSLSKLIPIPHNTVSIESKLLTRQYLTSRYNLHELTACSPVTSVSGQARCWERLFYVTLKDSSRYKCNWKACGSSCFPKKRLDFLQHVNGDVMLWYVKIRYLTSYTISKLLQKQTILRN